MVTFMPLQKHLSAMPSAFLCLWYIVLASNLAYAEGEVAEPSLAEVEVQSASVSQAVEPGCTLQP